MLRKSDAAKLRVTIYLVYFIHNAFQNARFKSCFCENLLRKGIFQLRLVVVQRFYGHTSRQGKNQLVPKCFIR